MCYPETSGACCKLIGIIVLNFNSEKFGHFVYLFELDRYDEVEKTNWKVIGKTEFDKAGSNVLFTSKTILYEDSNSETYSELLRKCF